jgi:hypothetical protein
MKNLSGRQSLAVSQGNQGWSHILWREWRNCDDEDYARHLFELVGRGPMGQQGTTLVVALGALGGAVAGLLPGIVSTVSNQLILDDLSQVIIWTSLILSPLISSLVGGGVGLLVRHFWTKPLPWPELLGRLAIGLVIGWGLIAVGGCLITLMLFLGILIAIVRKKPLFKAQHFDLLPVGLALGLSSGWCFWLVLWGGMFGWLIWLGLLVWLGSMLLTWWSITALLAQLRDLGKGSAHPIWRVLTPKANGPITTLASRLLPYRFRACYVWWHGQPKMVDVESALRQACAVRPEAEQQWREPLRRLEASKQQPGPPEKLIADLRSDDWVERFIARFGLVALGGEAVAVLVAFLQPLAEDTANLSRQLAIRLLKNISLETSARLANKAPWLLCPRCLARCYAHRMPLPWQADFVFYGCRTCCQSRELVDWPGKVVAVLDTAWAAEQIQQGNVWYVNWSQRRALFDFDRVLIVQATDEDVERFAVQVGNDTDPFRKPRYQQIPCRVKPEYRLSENTLRILERMFGQVERERED